VGILILCIFKEYDQFVRKATRLDPEFASLAKPGEPHAYISKQKLKKVKPTSSHATDFSSLSEDQLLLAHPNIIAQRNKSLGVKKQLERNEIESPPIATPLLARLSGKTLPQDVVPESEAEAEPPFRDRE
jgi:hypothetical protein